MSKVNIYISKNIDKMYEAQKDKYYSKNYMIKCLMTSYGDYYKKKFLAKYKRRINEYS